MLTLIINLVVYLTIGIMIISELPIDWSLEKGKAIFFLLFYPLIILFFLCCFVYDYFKHK